MRCASLLVVIPLLSLTAPAELLAQSCPVGGCPAGPLMGQPVSGPRYGGAYGDFVTPFPDVVRVFPRGGYTAYVPRGIDPRGDFSPYHQLYWMTPPAATAQVVLNRLSDLGIPLVPPETEFLGKNPRAARFPLPAPRRPEEKKPDDEDKKPDPKKDEDGKKEDKKDDKKEEKKDRDEPRRPEPGEKPPVEKPDRSAVDRLGAPSQAGGKQSSPPDLVLPAPRLPDPKESEKLPAPASPRP